MRANRPILMALLSPAADRPKAPAPIPLAAAAIARLLLLLLILGAGAGPCAAWAEPDASEALAAGQQDLGQTQQEIDKLSEELSGRRADRAALISELEARERDVAQLALGNRELKRLVAEHSRIAGELRKQQAQEREALRVQLGLLSELLRTAYVMGRADRLRLLLNQEDPTKASRVMSYFAFFNRERMKRVLTVQELTERLDRLAREAEAEAGRLAEFAKRQEQTRQQLIAAKQDRTKVLKQLETSIASRAETLDGLKRDADSLKRLVEHLKQKAQISAELDIHREPFQDRKGKLAWPLAGGRLVAAFGSPKQDTELVWDGVLLAAREGDEVRAVSNGRVAYADWMRGFGMMLVLDHGDGFMTLYGHNEALLRERDEWVAAGEPVALSGNSGGRAQPVLYFAVRHNGRPEDPAQGCAALSPAPSPGAKRRRR